MSATRMSTTELAPEIQALLKVAILGVYYSIKALTIIEEYMGELDEGKINAIDKDSAAAAQDMAVKAFARHGLTVFQSPGIKTLTKEGH